MQIRANELLRAIRLPRRGGFTPPASSEATDWRHYYRKVGTRKAQAISKVCFAGLLHRDGSTIRDVRIALGSVAPVPLRCVKTEAVLRGQSITQSLIRAAQAEVAREIQPIADMRSSAAYRSRVAQNLLAEFLTATEDQG
jgi:CO/xanthine dehydrogenase FAD-binding subunit